MIKKLTILDKYIIQEFWLPFISGCGIITGIWLSADQLKHVFKLITLSNTPISLAITILILHLPYIIVMTIPIGVLWGSFLVFSKLNNDSEIIALRTSGISLIRILKAVVIFGAFSALISISLNEVIVPISNPLVRKLEIYSVYKNPFDKIKNDFFYLERASNKKLKRIFYSAKYNADKDLLGKIIIIDLTRKGFTQIHTAKNARWKPEEGGWELYHGITHVISTKDIVSRISSFDSLFIPSGSSPAKLIKELSDPKEMNIVKLWVYLNVLKDKTIHTGDLNEALTVFYKKFSQPFSCILIAVIGACLGILPRRSSSNINYIILAVIIFQFYLMQSICQSMAESDKLFPFLAAWLPNFVLFIISMFLIHQKTKLS